MTGFDVVISLGLAGLSMLAFVAWLLADRRRRDAAIADVARRGMSRDRFPHRYVGPDTRFGLRRDTPCRRLRREQGDVVRVLTPDGREWNVPRARVALRSRFEA